MDELLGFVCDTQDWLDEYGGEYPTGYEKLERTGTYDFGTVSGAADIVGGIVITFPEIVVPQPRPVRPPQPIRIPPPV